MDLLGDSASYLWQRLPLILLFGGAYLVYQLMAATRLTDAFVSWALRRSHGSPAKVLLYIISTAAVLSSFIPNTITVLTLLPVLKRLDEDFRRQCLDSMTTVLMCAAIYGAAVGGLGSMIGSPANVVLFGALDFFDVAGRDQINFFNWFIWSVPLVLLLVLAAWLVASGLGLSARIRACHVDMECVEACEVNARQRYGGRIFWTYMGFWVGEAVLRQSVPGFETISPWLCLAFFALFLWLLFVRPAPDSEYAQGPLLRVADLLSAIPRRGLLFILVLAVLFALVRWLKLDEQAVLLAGQVLEGDMPELVLVAGTVLAVIFLTELLSNTAVVAAFFTIAFSAAQMHGLDPLYLMMGVSLASTCAFMTPIATPTNALAFGEMRGASLWRMMALGLVLNLFGAGLVTAWICWVLPLVY